MNAIDLTPGMRVYSHDGQHLGTVIEVWAESDLHGLLPRTQHLFSGYGPVGGTEHLFDTDNAYLQVRQGDFLGYGGRDLFVPAPAVFRTDDAGNVLLHTSTEHSENVFAERPATWESAA